MDKETNERARALLTIVGEDILRLKFTIGVQSFQIGCEFDADERGDIEFMREMFLKALLAYGREERRRAFEEAAQAFTNNWVKIVTEDPLFDFVSWCQQQANREGT